MKKQSSYFSALLQPLRQSIRCRPGSAVVPPLVLATVAVALLLLSGCSTNKPVGVVLGGVRPLADDLRSGLGTIALTRDARPANFSFDKADGKINYAWDQAGAAAGDMLATHTGEPLLDVVVGVGTLALAPVAALNGAIGARGRLSPDGLSECETNLAKAMKEMASQQRFQDWLLKAARERCGSRLVPSEQLPSVNSGGRPADAVLEARVEELRLERTGSGDTSYALRIKTRTRLVRVADGAVVCEQPAEYRSGKSLFLDWTLQNAFQSVADTGYQELAQYIVNQILATDSRPLLAGPGYRKVLTPNRGGLVKLAGGKAPLKRPSAQFVSFPAADTETLEIHPSTEVGHFAFQRPLTRDEAGSEALRDIQQDLDGLDEHPNMLVALPASLAMIPVSLWRQGAALARGVPVEKLQTAKVKLNEAAKQVQPHEALAVQVAQQLASHTSQPVMLVKEPLGSGTGTTEASQRPAPRGTAARLPKELMAVSYPVNQPPGTVLQIHVEQAALTGPGGVNPKLAFCVEAQATLLRSCDGRKLCSWPMKYRSKRRTFTTWAANGAKLFQAEQQKCWRELGTTIVDQLVLRELVLQDRIPQATFAQGR
jgi:hypothetical protein